MVRFSSTKLVKLELMSCLLMTCITAYNWTQYCWLLKMIIICGKMMSTRYHNAWHHGRNQKVSIDMLYRVWGPALHSPVAPIPACILSSNTGERGPPTITKCGNLANLFLHLFSNHVLNFFSNAQTLSSIPTPVTCSLIPFCTIFLSIIYFLAF